MELGLCRPTKTTMVIVLDSNEAATAPEISSAVKAQFPSLLISRLSCGDIFAHLDNGIFLVERKTPNDLLASIGDGRVFDQVRAMVEIARFVFVLIHGSLTYNHEGKAVADGRFSGWNAWSVEMALVALQAAGAIVVQTGARGHVETVKHLMAWCEKADDKWSMRKVVHWLPREGKRDFLAQLPGVGGERVDSLIGDLGDRPLIELLRHASTPSRDLPRLWGNGTINKVREFLGLRGTEVIQGRERSEWKEEID